MDASTFRQMGSDMLECIANYMKNIHDMPVVPDVKPGFLLQQLPSSPPEEGESWDNIYSDVNNLILPGVRIFFIVCRYGEYYSVVQTYEKNLFFHSS